MWLKPLLGHSFAVSSFAHAPFPAFFICVRVCVCVQSVGARIGRGAYAQVYKALWNDTGFYVAIKMFDTSQMTQETIDSVLVCFYFAYASIVVHDDDYVGMGVHTADGGHVARKVEASKYLENSWLPSREREPVSDA